MPGSSPILPTVLTVLLLGGLPAFCPAQEAEGTALSAEIDRIVTPYVAARDFMGVVAVQRDGEAPLVLPYGLASAELGVPHRETGIFLIGSISKQFTAVAILLLEQEGKLRTGDPVRRFLPDFKPETPITIEQLLTHTSGVADVYSLKRFSESGGQGGTLQEVIADLEAMELTFPPGTASAYSNGGYSVLAAVIERASGMAYGAYLTQRIFAPLGMSSTFHDGPAPVVSHRVPGYDPWGRDALGPARPPAPAYTAGSGSLWSSAEDLLTWNRAIHGERRLLTPTSYAKWTRNFENGYGFGVSVFSRFGRAVIGHDGRVAGYAADAARYLEDRLTVVILSNVQSVARDQIRRAVAAAALGEPVPEADRPALAEAPPEPLEDLVGVYSFGPNFQVTVHQADGRLLARANEGGDSQLVPTHDGAWFSRMLYATVRFQRSPEGRVDRVVWGRGEGAPVGRRLP